MKNLTLLLLAVLLLLSSCGDNLMSTLPEASLESAGSRGNIGADETTGERWVWTATEKLNLTYAFTNSMAMPAVALSDETVRNAFRDATAIWASVANVRFIEVSLSASPLFTVCSSYEDETYNANAFFPHGPYEYVLTLNPSNAADSYYTAEQVCGLFVHELGHVLGLAHEFSRPDLGGYFPFGEAYGFYDEDSVMYRPSMDLSAGDIATIQYLYGANPAALTKLVVAKVSASSDDGNVPANVLDGSLSTRWAANGIGQWISFDLGMIQAVSSVKLAWNKGNARVAYFDIEVSQDNVTWQKVLSGGRSSGQTLSLETYSFNPTHTRYIRVLGLRNSTSTWNSISEAQIHGSENQQKIVKGTLTHLSSSPNDGNVPQNTIDGNLSTRWSSYGTDSFITFDLSGVYTVTEVQIAWHKGNTRKNTFEIWVYDPNWGTNFHRVYAGESSGTSINFESYGIDKYRAEQIRIVCKGNTLNLWNSISEIQVFGKAH